jgi:prolyl 4-hydroxylase
VTGALELAAQCDAEGRHDDAVNALARAARENDYTAMTELGKRLIIGDRAPYLPKDGAKLLSDAARNGSADAAVRFACMMALGAHVQQSWDQAFGLLVHAAKLGSSSAQGQLRVLAGHDAESGGEDWLELARSVDLAAWLSPVEGKVLNETPRIAHYPNFVNPAACRWLMEQVREHLKPAQIYSGDHRRHVADQMRTNSVGPLHLACIDVVNVLVQYRIAAATRLPISNFDGPTALHYKVGEEIKNHFDYIHPESPNYEHEMKTRGERLVTFLVYLNGDYEGGETAFPALGISHSGARGEGLLFVNVGGPDRKPDRRSEHAGRPPTSGEKWVLSQFIREHPVFNTPAESLY